ncbi:MAG TPA: cytochrome c oxidase assembly protein [Usitatibacter sp.]|nr:cytochrome c oxidase assembly protein [Usitatibacter sp.]
MAAHPFDVLLATCLAVSAGLYVLGVSRLWGDAGTGRGVTRAQAARFALGWATLVAALVGPMDRWSEELFSVHMVQHELLMVVAAPLLVLGRPLQAWSWALPEGWVLAFARFMRRRTIAGAWHGLTEPLGAWTVHALALWAWHMPLLFEAALHSEGIHVAQHASFLASALCFWWAVVGRDMRAPRGAALVLVFTTMMHTSALGALLTLASTPWYPSYAAGSAGLTGLEDQQLGGLVMWMPGSLAYVAAALFIAYRWLARPRYRIAG